MAKSLTERLGLTEEESQEEYQLERFLRNRNRRRTDVCEECLFVGLFD